MYLTHWLRNSIIIFFLVAFAFQCQRKNDESQDGDPILASVFNEHLHFSDIMDLIPPVDPEDSIVVINNAINRWIKKTLLMREAERSIPKDLDLEKLVSDYRESLILHNYEQALVAENLDTSISETVLQSYYDQYKSQYVLKFTIVKALLIKVQRNEGPVNEVRSVLNASEPNIEEARSLIKDNSEVEALVDNYQWVRAIDLIDLLSDHQLRVGDMRAGRLIEFKTEKEMIFLKILDNIGDDEIAPIDYVHDQIVRIILHERKLNLLDQINENLYEQELRNNNINIYTR